MSQQNTHPFGDDNAVRIIPGPTGILQLVQLRKTSEIREGGHNGEMSTQEYVRKITEEASEDDHFTRGPRLSAVQYLAAEGSIAASCFGELKTFIKNGKLEKVVVVIKSCTSNMLGDLTVTLKDLSDGTRGIFGKNTLLPACWLKFYWRNNVHCVGVSSVCN
nr:hypothetical protein [Tanacetum cinerariifolium]